MNYGVVSIEVRLRYFSEFIRVFIIPFYKLFFYFTDMVTDFTDMVMNITDDAMHITEYNS